MRGCNPGATAWAVIASVLCLAVLMPANVMASPLQDASGGIEAYCPADGTLFSRIMVCLEDTIIETTVFFMNEFYPAWQNVVSTLMVLGVILFGVKIMSGGTNRIQRDSMVTLFKIAGVVYFMDEAVILYNDFVDILMSALNEVAGAATYSAALKCPYEGDAVFTTEPMWQRADCIFDAMIGLSADAAMNGGGGNYEGLSRGTMGFFYYNLKSGALGILIGLVGLYIGFNLLLALIRAAYTYLIALITLSFLFIIGALFVPLILFSHSYTNFEHWMKSVLAMILQPLILFAYVSVLITAFDIMLYSGENSLMKTIAGDAAEADDFNLHEYAEANLYSEDSKGFTHDIDQGGDGFVSGSPGEDAGLLGNAEFTDIVPDYANLSQINVNLPYRVVDYEQIDGGAAALAGATLMVGLASYILLTFMAEIPELAHDLGGGVTSTPGVVVHPANTQGPKSLPFSQTLTKAKDQLGSGITGQLTGMVTRR